jgi:hypothetical protein
VTVIKIQQGVTRNTSNKKTLTSTANQNPVIPNQIPFTRETKTMLNPLSEQGK